MKDITVKEAMISKSALEAGILKYVRKEIGMFENTTGLFVKGVNIIINEIDITTYGDIKRRGLRTIQDVEVSLDFEAIA